MELISALFKFIWTFAKTTWPSWIWFPPVMILIHWIKSPKHKGKSGESRVIKQLNKLSVDRYLVLNDILLRNDEITSQIDHVIVSVYGIFVIETKNYQGYIYGSEKSYNWTQNKKNF